MSSRFKHANVAVIVLTLAATLAAVFNSFALSANPTTWRRWSALSPADRAARGHLPPAAWATAGIVQGDLVQFAAFAAVNIAAAAAVFALVSAPIRASELAAHVVQAARDVLVRRR